MITINKLTNWTKKRQISAGIDIIQLRESIIRYFLRLLVGLPIILLVGSILGLACYLTGILSFADGFTGGLIGATFGWNRLCYRKLYVIDSIGELNVSKGPTPLFGTPPPYETLLVLTEIQSYSLICKKHELEISFRRRLDTDLRLHLSVNKIDCDQLKIFLERQIGFGAENII